MIKQSKKPIALDVTNNTIPIEITIESDAKKNENETINIPPQTQVPDFEDIEPVITEAVVEVEVNDDSSFDLNFNLNQRKFKELQPNFYIQFKNENSSQLTPCCCKLQ